MKKRRIGIVFLVMTLLAGCLSGCGGNGNTAGDGTEFSFWCTLGDAATLVTDLGDTELYKELEKRTGVHMEFIHSIDDSQFNVMIASGEYPDLIERDWSSYPGAERKACEDGILIDLTDMIKEHAPNYYNFVENVMPEVKRWVTTDGRYYTIPNLAAFDNYTATSGLLVRKDLLDKYGLEMPKTIADWENVLTVFKENGVKYPVCMNLFAFNAYTPFYSAYNVNQTLYQEDGTMKYGYIEPAMKEFVETFRRWIEKGLVDPDLTTQDGNTMKGKIANGEAGAWLGNISDIKKYTTQLKSTIPDIEIVGAPYPTAKEGEECKVIYLDRVDGYTYANQVGISTACKNPEKALEWLDYAFSEEGHMLYNFGIEGESYTMVDGYPTYTEKITNHPDGLDFRAALSMYARPSSAGYVDERYMDQLYDMPQQQVTTKMWSENGNKFDQACVWRACYKMTVEEANKANDLSLNFSDYATENFLKFLTGIKPMSEYDAFVEELKTMGVYDFLKVYQTAYDRVMGR